jgi:hypothetical protein
MLGSPQFKLGGLPKELALSCRLAISWRSWSAYESDATFAKILEAQKLSIFGRSQIIRPIASAGRIFF